MNDIVLDVIDSYPVFGPFPETAELVGQSRIAYVVKIKAPDMILSAVVSVLVGINQAFQPLPQDKVLMMVNKKFQFMAELQLLIHLTPHFSLGFLSC
ncbi:hypothetical protein D3C87_1817030 [compost metagenome]